MRIYGLDFTSSPRPAKPITCAACGFDGGVLTLHCLAALPDLDSFENFLGSQGPWVAAIDFPFGQPRDLVRNLGWPRSWEGYVGRTESMTPEAFECLIGDYCAGRARGDKHHRRRVDVEADARSPMMLHRVPVGKMFLQGAPRLRRSPACVLPCRPNADERVVLEGYPALVARRLIGRRRYKSEARREQIEDRRQARAEIVCALASRALSREYAVRAAIDPCLVEVLVEEASGDSLDALLCALQAAWAFSRQDRDWGIPARADPLEGWIVDPALVSASARCAPGPEVSPTTRDGGQH